MHIVHITSKINEKQQFLNISIPLLHSILHDDKFFTRILSDVYPTCSLAKGLVLSGDELR